MPQLGFEITDTDSIANSVRIWYEVVNATAEEQTVTVTPSKHAGVVGDPSRHHDLGPGEAGTGAVRYNFQPEGRQAVTVCLEARMGDQVAEVCDEEIIRPPTDDDPIAVTVRPEGSNGDFR